MTPTRPSPTPPEIVIVVTEALDGPAVARWGPLITDAAAMAPARLVIDLTASPRIDAAAIVLLLQVHRRQVCVDGRLILRGPVPLVRRMLSLARIDRVFDIDDTGAQATIAARPALHRRSGAHPASPPASRNPASA